jgi:hypothetical protein
MFPFANGRPPGPRRLVETTLRIASAPSIGVAREEARVVVDGVEQRLEIVRQERIHGGKRIGRARRVENCAGICTCATAKSDAEFVLG